MTKKRKLSRKGRAASIAANKKMWVARKKRAKERAKFDHALKSIRATINLRSSVGDISSKTVRYQIGSVQDKINHPEHYQGEGLEAIDVIEKFGLDMHRGTAVKYILRSGRKGSVLDDIKKAIWYLVRYAKFSQKAIVEVDGNGTVQESLGG